MLKAHRIVQQIKELQEELSNHQKKCKHPKAVKIPKSNTGNYDPDMDCYWLDCSCPTCLRRWTEDQ